MRRMIAQFHGCLAPGAWLLVGPSEPNMTYFTSLRAVNAPGVTLYQKPAEAALDDAAPAQSPDVPPPPVPREEDFNRPSAPSIPAPGSTGNESSVPTLTRLLELANRGDWDSAACCGRQLLAADNLNASVHFH